MSECNWQGEEGREGEREREEERKRGRERGDERMSKSARGKMKEQEIKRTLSDREKSLKRTHRGHQK